jgi:hypothetical protein
VKSYTLSFDCKRCSDDRSFKLNNTGFTISTGGYVAFEPILKLFISDLVFVDPNGKEYTLPGKLFVY